MNGARVVVVGAGLAGLVAARELRRLGCDATVVEARDRIGGRTWTSSGLGLQIEMGGTWVHWTQPHVWAEISRYGLSVRERPRPSRFGVLDEGAVEWLDARRFGARIESAERRFLADVREVFPRPTEPFANRAAVAALDGSTVADRIAGLGLPRAERDLAEVLWSVHFNAPASEGALTQALRWAALHGWDAARLLEAAAVYKLPEGISALVGAIAADAGEVRLATRVERIVQGEAGGVTVVLAGGEEIAADAVVVAVPLNTLAAISFEPALSEPVARLVAERQASRGVKLFIRVDSQLEPTMGVAPLPHPINHFRTEFWDDWGTVLVAFNLDGSLELDDNDAVERALRAWFAVRVTGTASHDWTRDPLSNGTWGMLRPNQLTASLEAAQEPHGSVVFAGSDLALGWAGFIDGAIESGMHASRAVAGLVGDRAKVARRP